MVYVKGESSPTRTTPTKSQTKSTVKTTNENKKSKDEVSEGVQHKKTGLNEDVANMNEDSDSSPADVKNSDAELPAKIENDDSKEQKKPDVKGEDKLSGVEEKFIKHEDEETLDEGTSSVKVETPVKSEIGSNIDTERELTEEESEQATESDRTTAESDQDIVGKEKEVVVITKAKPLEERISQITEGILSSTFHFQLRSDIIY